MTKVSEIVKSMTTSIKQSSTVHGESQIQIERDQSLVENMKTLIKTRMTDPFTMENTSDLINISTGQKSQSTDLVNAYTKGVEALHKAE